MGHAGPPVYFLQFGDQEQSVAIRRLKSGDNASLLDPFAGGVGRFLAPVIADDAVCSREETAAAGGPVTWVGVHCVADGIASDGEVAYFSDCDKYYVWTVVIV
jgi:hypothetical protein